MKIIPTTFALFLSLLNLAHGQMYKVPTNGDDIIGELIIIEVGKGDRLEKIAQNYNISYQELRIANPGIPNIIRADAEIIIPSLYILPPVEYREGIVVNLAEPRLYYFTPDGKYVFTAPVAVGRMGWRTPLFEGKVVRKAVNPIWVPPESIRNHYLNKYGETLPDFISPGPDNPLGNYALYLSENRILIHGTNDERTIGKYISSGCIRMYNNDIQTLFRMVQRNAQVAVIHHSVKIGEHNGDFYIEAHPAILNHNHELISNEHNRTDVNIINQNGIPYIAY